MKFAPRLIAVFVLLGWLFAIGHLAAVHGAGAYSSVDHELFGHEDDRHDEDPDHHHHHGITVLPPGPLAKGALQKAPIPVWIPLFDPLAERVTLLLPRLAEWQGDVPLWNAPPDARASGWLFVCRTARPVRGPSLAV